MATDEADQSGKFGASSVERKRKVFDMLERIFTLLIYVHWDYNNIPDIIR